MMASTIQYARTYLQYTTYIIEILYTQHRTRVVSNPNWLDFSFADEPAARYGSEILTRDFTGDGINDFSAGVLAGYVYGWLGVFTPLALGGWDIAWEAYASILPGLDPRGIYVTIAYDWLGHGTNCAGVIASRGRVTMI